MKKNMIFIVFLLMCTLGIFGCAKKENTDDPKKNSAEEHTQTENVKIIKEDEIQSGNESEKELEKEPEQESEDPTVEPDIQMPEKKGILIALDPGHQGPNVDMSAQEPNAPGSEIMKTKAAGGTAGSFTGIPEYQLNLDIALMVRDCLTAQGYDVIMTRENNDTAISNAERATLANEAGADISVRIHANGSGDPGVNGALVLIGSAENPYVGGVYDSSYRLAETILNAYCNLTGMQNLGIQLNDTMTGINWSQIPVVILEMGFMTNQQDDTNMADAAYRETMVNGIVEGINAYYGF